MEEIFNAFLEEAKKKEIVLNYVQIRKHNEIVLDWGRMTQKTRLNTWSVSKSFISVAVGIAIDEGLISLDEKICDSFKEYLPEKPSKNLTDITVRHMLTMTTGFAHALFFSDDPERYVTKDWIKYFFKQDFPYAPGERFLYCNFNTYMLGCLIEKKAGMKLLDYLNPRLFEPLGILSPDWTTCPMGHVHGANGLYLTIDDFGRFGQMILNKGTYNGKKIVSEEYLKMATVNQIGDINEGRHYGFQFWMNPDGESFRADGKYGQYIFVLPQDDMVVAIQSLDSNDVMKEVWNNLITKIRR